MASRTISREKLLPPISSPYTHPWVPHDAPFPCTDTIPGPFLWLSTSLLDGDPRHGILGHEDGGKEREKTLPACPPGIFHAAQSNSAGSISLSFLVCCRPDPGGRNGKEATLWMRPAMVSVITACLSLLPCIHLPSLLDQKLLALHTASTLVHIPPPSSCNFSAASLFHETHSSLLICSFSSCQL